MTDTNRRAFLKMTALSASLASLAGCGGGGMLRDAAGAGAPQPPSTEPGAGGAPSSVPGAATGEKQFTLIGSSANPEVTYCVGFPFRQGDIPAGSAVVANQGSFQFTAKNIWPDGSLRFAVLAGRVAMPATGIVAVTLSASTAVSGGAALTLGDLKRTGILAEVGAGAFGEASWSQTDWDAPFATWETGPVMASWIYRKPIGEDPHLVAWLEVRLFDNGAVDVLPWVENGYLRVPGPTNRNATYTFRLNGTQRFSAEVNLLHHQRLVLVSGSLLSHWLGSDPGVAVRHDTAYMQATEMVPTYLAHMPPGAGRVTAQPTSYVPLMQGSWSYSGDDMASPGYQEPIGLLAEHDVLYLAADAADSARVYRSVIWNGYGAGRYGTHYRDETTHRPARFSSYPTLVLAGGASSTSTYTPAPTGGNPPNFDHAHHPSIGYLPYLVTGRWYFMEECQFVTTHLHLGKTDIAVMRDGAQGLVKSDPGGYQTRAAAWAWRTKLTAYAATPDSDVGLRSEFKASVQANIDHYFNRYVGQAGNVFGIIEPGEAYNDSLGDVAIWQQDFFTAVTGWGLAMDLALDAGYKAKLQQFFAWKARGVVNRLGPQGQWWWVNPAPYAMKVSSSTRPDYINGTGPFYTVSQAYEATYPTPGTGSLSWMSSVEGVLASEYFPEATTPSMFQNMQPALAYAVRHGVPGALDGYNKVVGARNWGDVVGVFQQKPVWSVAPAAGR